MRWQQIGFRKRLLIIMTLTGLVELLVLVAAGFLYLKSSQEQEVGEKALGVATFLAQSPDVVTLIEENQPSQDQQAKYRELTKQIGAAFIVIGDKTGVRLVHPVDERIGLPMRGGDNTRALVDGEAYISYAEGSLGYSVRGKTAVFNQNGDIIGVVSVGYLLARLQDRVEPFLFYLLFMTIAVVSVNAVISSYVSRRFQRAILGFEPEEIGRLYGELDVTMSTLKEGILSIDDQARIRSINTSACQILGLSRQGVINQPLKQVLPDSDLDSVLISAKTDHDINLYLNGHKLIANRSPIIVDGAVIGAVSSFRLRDEINELTEQLAQTKAYADMLRSQTHEHRNKLSTISGMISMGELESVQRIIGQETEHYQQLIASLRETIKEPLVAGLLLGKTERARELGLTLVIETGSRLLPLPQWLDAQDLVTILGNLVDNAYDAVLELRQRGTALTSANKSIEVSISDYGNEVILEVSDCGCGLPEELSGKDLVKMGVTSKQNDTRGVGLYLVNRLIERYSGHLEIIANAPSGTRMTVYLPKEMV